MDEAALYDRLNRVSHRVMMQAFVGNDAFLAQLAFALVYLAEMSVMDNGDEPRPLEAAA